MKSSSSSRRAFTLIELLMVMMIIALLASITVVALASAMEEGRKTRARAQIAKIDALIMDKWNSYHLRKLPLRFAAGTPLRSVAASQLAGMRELQRMEMPDRMSDILDNGVILSRPAISQFYNRTVQNAFTTSAVGSNILNEQAECLYLILSQMKEGNRSAISGFLSSEIGDTDGDGLPEILDPWGTPIRFLRWAPGYSINVPDWTAAPYSQTPSELHLPYFPVTSQKTVRALPDGTVPAPEQPDPFDPWKVDPRWKPNATLDPYFWSSNDPSITYRMTKPFALKPLIICAGPDRSFDVQNGYFLADGTSGFSYRNTKFDSTSVTIPNDPYYVHVATDGPYAGKPLPWIGSCRDIDGDGQLGYADNITNHDLSLSGQ